MPNPYLESGYDSVTQTHHCTYCELPLFDPHTVLNDHIQCVWSHFAFIQYPKTLATDAKGKTIERKIQRPARKVLAKIPYQTSLSFCMKCFPAWFHHGCGMCANQVDTTHAHSQVEILEKTKDQNRNYKILHFHHDCLPDIFSKVKEYVHKYS